MSLRSKRVNAVGEVSRPRIRRGAREIDFAPIRGSMRKASVGDRVRPEQVRGVRGADPTERHLVYQPDHVYFVAAGKFQRGQVLDPVVNQSVMLPFDGVSAMTATFNPDHTWTVVPA